MSLLKRVRLKLMNDVLLLLSDHQALVLRTRTAQGLIKDQKVELLHLNYCSGHILFLSLEARTYSLERSSGGVSSTSYLISQVPVVSSCSLVST